MLGILTSAATHSHASRTDNFRRLRFSHNGLTLSARTAVGQDRAAITSDPNASVDLLRQVLESVIGESELTRAQRAPARGVGPFG